MDHKVVEVVVVVVVGNLFVLAVLNMKNSAAFRVRNKYQHTTWVYYRIFNVTYIWKFYLQLALTTACWYLVWHLYVEAISLSGQKFLLPVLKPKM